MNALDLRVTLRGPREVWRTIRVREDATLHALHRAICGAFAWNEQPQRMEVATGKILGPAGRHLYEFKVRDGRTFMEPNPDIAKASRENPPLDSRTTEVGGVFARRNERIVYVHDLGCEWIHDVVLLDRLELPDDAELPAVIGRLGDRPEDQNLGTVGWSVSHGPHP